MALHLHGYSQRGGDGDGGRATHNHCADGVVRRRGSCYGQKDEFLWQATLVQKLQCVLRTGITYRL